MTKKHLLFALIVCMSTVWRFLELLEYGEIEVRQVDTYMYFYMLATCFVSFLVGKESATAKKANSQYIEALNAPHHINENVSCYTDYASGMRQRTPCKLDYDTHRVFDIVAPCNDEEDDVVVKRSILLPPENDGTVREVRIFDLDERDECGELPDPKTIEGLYRGYKDRDMYWTCADENVIEPADAVHYVRQRALAQYLTDSGHAGLLMEDDFEPLEEPLKRTTDWLASKDESRFEELYTAYAAGLYAAQTEQLQNKNNNTQEV